MDDMLTTNQSYLIHSLSNYIFYSSQRERYGLSPFNTHSLHIFLMAHRDCVKRILAFLFLDMNIQSKSFVDLVCSDFPSRVRRFYMYYNTLSTIYGLRYFVSCIVGELDKMPSITPLFCSSAWYEREVWDLFGIHFEGNSDLRRILTDYGFQGHPLRKDFPLSGFVELFYSERANSVMYQPVSLIQEYRYFNTLSPWDWTPLE